VQVLQVTDASERTMQLRALVSAADSSTCWDLRCRVREGLIAYLQANYPQCLPRDRMERIRMRRRRRPRPERPHAVCRRQHRGQRRPTAGRRRPLIACRDWWPLPAHDRAPRHSPSPTTARCAGWSCRSRRSPVVTGPNGSGKSSVYRAAAAGGHRTGRVIPSLAREGGLPSTLWAGPERFSRAMLAGDTPVTGTVRNRPVSLKLGCVRRLRLCDRSGPAGAGQLAIHARSRREARMYLERRAAAAVDAAGRTTGRQIRTRTASGDWRTVPQPVASFDSMMTEFADPVGAPEMIAVRERIRSWRFYDHFRTDAGRRRGGRTSARTRRCSRTTVPISRRRCRRSARSAMPPLDATIDDAFRARRSTSTIRAGAAASTC
jgi:hypothetical protein